MKLTSFDRLRSKRTPIAHIFSYQEYFVPNSVFLKRSNHKRFGSKKAKLRSYR